MALQKERDHILRSITHLERILNSADTDEEEEEVMKYESWLEEELAKHLIELDMINKIVFGSGMRAAQLEFIKRISERSGELSTDPLLRRSYISSLYNTCTSSLLQHRDFSDLSQYFPKLKLPLVLSDSDLSDFETAQLDGLNLKLLLRKYLVAFKPFRYSTAEDHLRNGLWTPLLTDLLSYVSGNTQCSELIAVNGMTTKMFQSTSFLRTVDFAACPRENGIPVLLVEMAQSAVPTNKDMKRLCLLMVFALSELINRAGIMCPDEDLTKLRVYGILISGSIFELCVCTVVKGADGHFGFVFHSNEFHWKFSLFGAEMTIPEEEASKSADFICNGNRSVLGTFEDMKDDEKIQKFDFERIVSETDIKELLEREFEMNSPYERHFSEFFDDQNLNNFYRSSVILIKFLTEMIMYYKDLSDSLRSVYITEQDFSSNDSLTLQFPSGLPYYPKSQSKTNDLILRSGELVHEKLEIGSCMYQMYLKQFTNRNPTLPDVVNFDSDLAFASVRIHNMSIIDFTRYASKCFTSKVLEIFIAKMVLDLYLAVLEIHSEGFVCGSVEPQYIVYDHAHFRFSVLPRLVKSSEAHLVDVEKIKNYRPSFHLRNSGLCERDDLNGIAQTVEHSLRSRMYDIMDRREGFPLLMKFLNASWCKFYQCSNYSEVDPIQVLEESLPIFAEMLAQLDVKNLINYWKNNEVDPHSTVIPLRMTYRLAEKTLIHLKRKALTTSIEAIDLGSSD